MTNNLCIMSLQCVKLSVADPGFFPEGGANSPGGWGGGAPTHDFSKFSRKQHEIERIWVLGGRPSHPPDPPMIMYQKFSFCN